ncbi:putative flavoprotein involved in K+ transport [Limnobacter thiooxidans]|uniref:MSMEG_0569 family flavin-dependent oxidoreductase n=1 Tax=Limnobacter thiooxidans TaxID=131080 RepID=A0AA86IYK0_9BURK|nr:putative flavoprotein involved in K+ transport [Limnobacter thiooxidans]BET25653.1 MSMEG_0569 family flavin-dependent oxidoreductase [Limnobacter thiooxidans]
MNVDARNLKDHYSVAVIGGGQAGLSMSYHLTSKEIDHVVLERNQIGHSWRQQRWDTFCLVTPNWQCKLPGFPYAGPEPHGFMKKDDIVAYLEAFAASFNPPVFEGVAVKQLRKLSDGLFEIQCTKGTFTVNQVVVAVGGYHKPRIPRIAEKVPSHIQQIHSSEYRNPSQLPQGNILVIGSGQSGCQIAEDLHLAGRGVHLAVGSAPRVARRYRGRDVVDWLADMGHYDMPVELHPQKEAVRGKANHYVTGRDGGRDIDLRIRAKEGMQLHGRVADCVDGVMHFADDLVKNLDNADQSSENIKNMIDGFIAEKGISAPQEARYVPVWQPKGGESLIDLVAENVTGIVWSVGFESSFDWIDLPIFNGKGYPNHYRGVSREPGVYFLGLPWLHTWGSGRFSGVARDSAFLLEKIEQQLCASLEVTS